MTTYPTITIAQLSDAGACEDGVARARRAFTRRGVDVAEVTPAIIMRWPLADTLFALAASGHRALVVEFAQHCSAYADRVAAIANSSATRAVRDPAISAASYAATSAARYAASDAAAIRDLKRHFATMIDNDEETS